MHPLLKWPGGKSSEIGIIEKHIPKYERYVEPFFGGGALFFHLKPPRAAINDISGSLMEFYELIKQQDERLRDYLICYCDSFSDLMAYCESNYSDILGVYRALAEGSADMGASLKRLSVFTDGLAASMGAGFSDMLLQDDRAFIGHINKSVMDKMRRTIQNDAKKPFSGEDLKNNLITGFTSGFYMYFRDVFNAISLKRIAPPSAQYGAANFCFIREYCYGSMFRYNSKGEFNIPYGGISYNSKNFRGKVDGMFGGEAGAVFGNTDIHCSDFEDFFDKIKLTRSDFMFLDPPYDTDFSDYEGRDFTRPDHERLARRLASAPASFMLVIKNTGFIYDLYKRESGFNIMSFDNRYAYNVRSRNEREAKHLMITNYIV